MWIIVTRDTINREIARFQASKGSKHSCGAFYLTWKNNHRSVRFLCEETILVAVFPGPSEPSLEQINQLLEPFERDMLRLYDGNIINISVNIHNS